MSRAKKRKRKHEVRRKRQSARERLLEYYHEGVGCYEPRCGSCKHFAKLLRAHEREMAERADAAAIDALHANGMTPLADIGDAVRAAILAPQAKRGRAR